MSAPRFGPSVGDAIATLRSDRGAYGANQVNADFRQNQANFLMRQIEMYGESRVSDVLQKFPILKETLSHDD